MVTLWSLLFRGAGEAVSRRTPEPRGDDSLWLCPGLGCPAGLLPEGPAPAGEAGLAWWGSCGTRPMSGVCRLKGFLQASVCIRKKGEGNTQGSEWSVRAW